MTGLRLARSPLRVLTGAALVVLGARLLVSGVADHLAGTQPQHALGWRNGQPEALLRAASARLDAGDVPAARLLARSAVSANPLDGRGYRELARTAEADGDVVQARALMEQAARHAPRDPYSHAWLLQHLLGEGRLDEGLRHVDALLRVDPARGETLYPALAALVDDAQARPPLAALLARNPTWRAAFWNRLCSDGSHTDAIATLVGMLEGSAAPLQPAERAAWLERLIRDHRWAQAYPLWVDTLPPERRASLSNVYDGSFEYAPGDVGFGWRIGHIAGADIAQRGMPGARSLRIEFADRRVAFRHVRQLLALPPGDYRLQGRTRTEALHNERGLQWVIDCAEGHGQRVGATERFSGSGPWRDFATGFVVPDHDCGAQWLQLELAARVPAEQQVSGIIEFTGLEVTRADASVHP